MQITANEIDNIEEVGMLHGNSVKMVRCKGGFYIALGRKKGKVSEEALSAGSHPAIVKYHLEKQYPEYQPNMMKSEGQVNPIVISHSHFLANDLRKSGYDIFSIQTGPSVEFYITKLNANVAVVPASLVENQLFIEELNIPKEFAKSMAGSTLEKAIACKVGLALRRD
jgi:hypothetical protein